MSPATGDLHDLRLELGRPARPHRLLRRVDGIPNLLHARRATLLQSLDEPRVAFREVGLELDRPACVLLKLQSQTSVRFAHRYSSVYLKCWTLSRG